MGISETRPGRVRYSVAAFADGHQSAVRGHRLWRGGWAWILLASAVACSGDATGPNTPGNPVGNYTMQSINQQALPFAMFTDTLYSLEVQSGTLAVTTDGKWWAKTTTRETVAGNVSTYVDSTFGTWTQSSGSTSTAVLLNTETQGTANATWTTTDLTLVQVESGTTYTIVYRRQ